MPSRAKFARGLPGLGLLKYILGGKRRRELCQDHGRTWAESVPIYTRVHTGLGAVRSPREARSRQLSAQVGRLVGVRGRGVVNFYPRAFFSAGENYAALWRVYARWPLGMPLPGVLA